MTPLATRLAEQGLLTSREAHTLSDLEFDYRQRLTRLSEERIERHIPAYREDEVEQVFADALSIIAFAKERIARGSRARTYIGIATAEVYRVITLDWFVGIQPYLECCLSYEQFQSVKSAAAPLYRRVGGDNA